MRTPQKVTTTAARESKEEMSVALDVKQLAENLSYFQDVVMQQQQSNHLTPPAADATIALADDVIDALSKFFLLYDKKNQLLEPQNQQSSTLFFAKYGNKVMQLVQFFGVDAISLMQKALQDGELEAIFKKLPDIGKETEKTLILLFNKKEMAFLPAQKNYAGFVNDLSSLLIFMDSLPYEMRVNPPPWVKDALELIYKDQLVCAGFFNFCTLCREVNRAAAPEHQKDIEEFFSEYAPKLVMLIKLMGVDAIHFMRKQLAGTVLPLTRMLDTLSLSLDPLINPLSDYFVRQKTTDGAQISYQCCLLIAALAEARGIDIMEDEAFVAEITQMTTGASLQQFFTSLTRVVIIELFPDDEIKLDDAAIEDLFKRIPPEYFVKLVHANQQMKEDEYHAIFIHLLKLDILGEDVSAFLHESKKEDALGHSLSQHNQEIRRILEEKGILAKNALQYPKTYSFMIETAPQNPSDNMYAILWLYLTQLQKVILEMPPQEQNLQKKLDAIIKYFEKIQTNINAIKSTDSSSLHVIADELSKEHNLNLVKIVLKNITAAEQHIELPPQFARDVKESWHNIETERDATKQIKTKKKSNAQPCYFTVEQWSKEKVETFFLGDHVGCCLATDGLQFQAMIQRRMDDACLFHVAIDQRTGKPAALAWLYLATTADGKTVLMANFFEVHTKYAKDETIRRGLLNGILEFTHQYLKDNPKIDGFYMNKLNYGWNTQDLTSYPCVKLNITDKVGGPYLPPGEDNDSVSTADKYYLRSLEKPEGELKLFHQFSHDTLLNDLDVLTQNPARRVVSLREIIQSELSTLQANQNMDEKEIIDAIFKKHTLTLSHFYHLPLLENEPCLSFIRECAADLSKKNKENVQESKSTYGSLFALPPSPPPANQIPADATAPRSDPNTPSRTKKNN